MSGFVIIDVEVTDAELHAQFRDSVDAFLPSFGGKHVVRGSQIDVIEGNWSPSHLVMMEFESVERAREFLTSPEFTGLAELRARCTGHRNVVVVSGA